jgi:hypothetical protein
MTHAQNLRRAFAVGNLSMGALGDLPVAQRDQTPIVLIQRTPVWKLLIVSS